MDHRVTFDLLPAEILLLILSYLPDIESLDSAIRASPDAWRLFDQYGVEIAETVLTSKNTHRYTCTIIYTIACVRQNRLPVNNVSDLQDQVTCIAVQHRDGGGDKEPSEDAFTPDAFPEGSTSAHIRQILATARRIRSLTVACLDFYLERFRNLQPLVPVNPKYRVPRSLAIRFRAQDPPKQPYDVHDVGKTNWSEEQLVYRAFWRIQLVEELKQALKSGVISNWTEPEKRHLCEMEIEDVYDFESALSDAQYAWDSARFLQSEIAEHSLILSVAHFLEAVGGKLSPTERAVRNVPEPGPADDEILSSDWTVADLKWGTMYLYHSVISDYGGVKTFPPFRRLGFAIWSEERLAGYGFEYDGSDRLEGSYVMAWLSVLNAEDHAFLEGLERQNLKKDEIAELEELFAADASHRDSHNWPTCVGWDECHSGSTRVTIIYRGPCPFSTNRCVDRLENSEN